MQPTVAVIDATVGLPADVKGTHMSRFVEVLNGVRGELSLNNLSEVLAAIQRRLGAEQAQIDVRFPYFMSRRAPVSGAESLMQYQAAFHAERDGDRFDFVLEVSVPVTTLCPCSKAVSERGAHNQRSQVTVKARGRDFFWIEEIVDAVERCASSPVYALLKREDEKYVTEYAYDHPRFVEDLIREVCRTLSPKATWLDISVENFESIHNHSAWAHLCWSLPSVPPEASGASSSSAPTTAQAIAFGPWLRQRRLALGWSQQELADKIGVSASYLCKVEAGERVPAAASLDALGAALNVEPVVVRLRAGNVPEALLARIATDPEAFVRWAQG